MNENIPKVPRAAIPTYFPFRGTLILILWQRTFAWPSAVYAVLWTLWALAIITTLVDLWRESGDDTTAISDKRWREVFK